MVASARLVRVPLSGSATPGQALRALADEPWPFALAGGWAGGGAIVGARPLRVATADEDAFALLDELPAVASDAPLEAVGGGWFGWLGFGLGARVERLAPPPPRPAPMPPFQLAYHDHVLRLDRDGRWWFEALETPARAAALARRRDELRARLTAAAALPPTATPAPPPFALTGAGGDGHLAAVRACRERIAAGEIFQANLCLRLETEWDGDVAELFAHAGERLRPAFGAAFPTPDGGIASLSPELFLRRRGREVESGPIKGTIARTGPTADDAARDALADSAKDRAEHVMIVDLMRNDLGRVSVYGSIVAAAQPEPEPHPGLWHLVSRVRGRLRDGAGDGELLRATFPPGSVTGAPKVQALHVIGELEATAREAYTGAIGYASPLAGLELSVAIRTFEARDGRLWLGAGGGIVADSDPAAELEECLVKARPLVAAIGGRIAEPAHAEGDGDAPPAASSTTSPIATPALSRDRHRPDATHGVFETLLVRDGEALRAPAHLARIAASAAALYASELPDDLAARVEAAAAELSAAGALRIVVRPRTGGDGAAMTLERGRMPARPLPIALRPFTLPGGLGTHKWRDRRLLNALTAGEAVTPLLLDGDGDVLETAWGNVFALEGDALVTPPADGRILPGVTRAAVLAAASELGLAPLVEPLSLMRLAHADAIVVSSSLVCTVPALLASPRPGGRGRADLGAAPHALDAREAASGAFALARRLTSRLEPRPISSPA
ncbi:MAG TPA: chorismate-binding protein [Conexibacter sp.]|nr:chorismate-binding protein [Conexibacter sp.]